MEIDNIDHWKSSFNPYIRTKLDELLIKPLVQRYCLPENKADELYILTLTENENDINDNDYYYYNKYKNKKEKDKYVFLKDLISGKELKEKYLK